MLQYDYKLQMHWKLTRSDHEILIMCENNIISSQVCLHSRVNSQQQNHQVRLREAVFFATAEQNYQTRKIFPGNFKKKKIARHNLAAANNYIHSCHISKGYR